MTRQKLAEIALVESRKHIRETDGSNRGPGIEKYWTAVSYRDGYKDRQPYCAAAVCWMVAEAARFGVNWRSPLPTFAAVKEFLAWARKEMANGRAIVFTMNDPAYHPEPGDIICFLPKLSHLGVVVGFPGLTIDTVEANTSPEPLTPDEDRDGGGVYRRVRKITFGGYFIRLLTQAEPK